tara:strand:+ start:4591 stop:4983 length:393 start_codon:yes stop_codon:yes gene_type:complete
MKNNIIISIVLFVMMFIISGVSKVSSFGSSESVRLATKLPEGISEFSQIIVLLAGLFELISSFAIIYGSYYEKPDIAIYGIYGLMLFTTLATLIFYTFPLKYKPALSNLSVISGLYLMMNICFFKNEIPF